MRSPTSSTTAAAATRCSWRSWPSWSAAAASPSSCPTPSGPSSPPGSTSCPSTSGPCSTTPRCSGRRGRTARWSSSARRSARTSAARSSTRSPTPACWRSRAGGGGSARPASARSRTTPSTKADRARRHIGVAKAMVDEAHKAGRPDVLAHHWATAAELAGELGGSSPGVPATWSTRRCRRCWRPPLHDVDRLYPRPAIEQVARALSIGDCQLEGSTRRSLVLTRRGVGRAAAVPCEAEADLQAVVDEAEAEGDRRLPRPGPGRAGGDRPPDGSLRGRPDRARRGRRPAGGPGRRRTSWRACSGRGA